MPRSPDPQTVQLHRQPRVRLMRFNSACAGSAAEPSGTASQRAQIVRDVAELPDDGGVPEVARRGNPAAAEGDGAGYRESASAYAKSGMAEYPLKEREACGLAVGDLMAGTR